MDEIEVWPRFNIQLRPAIVLADAEERVYYRALDQLSAGELMTQIDGGLKWLKRPREDAATDPFAEVAELLGRGDPRSVDAALQRFQVLYRNPQELDRLSALVTESRLRAVKLMGTVQDGSLRKLLMRILRNDPNDFVCAAAGGALALSATPADVPELLDVVQDTSQVWIQREAALEAIGGVVDRCGPLPKAETVIIKLAETDSTAIRHLSVSFLGRMRSRKAIPALLAILKRDSETARANEGKAAIKALGEIAEPRAAVPLKETQARETPAARDPSAWMPIRWLAAEAACSRALCGDPDVIPLLIAMMEWPDQYLSARSKLALVTGRDLGSDPEESGRLYLEWFETNRGRTRETWLVQSLFGPESKFEELATTESVLALETRAGADQPEHVRRGAEDLIRWLAADIVIVDPGRWLKCNRPYLYWKSNPRGRRALAVDGAARVRQQATAQSTRVFP